MSYGLNHVVVRCDGNYTLECKRCGQTYTPALPIAISLFVGLTKTFEREHKDCKPAARSASGSAERKETF